MSKRGAKLLAMVVLAGPFLLLSGCAVTPPPTAVGASLEDDVRAFEAEVMASYNRGDAARAASHYAPDAFVFIPNQPPTRGRDAIALNIARFMRDPNFRLGYVNQSTDVSDASDMAYTRGQLTVSYTDPTTNSVSTINSNYLLVMRRRPGSEWRIVEDISF